VLRFLEAVRDALQASGRFKSVFLTPQVSDDWGDMIPPWARLPAAGVADGPEEAARDLAAEGVERTLEIRVSLYVAAHDEPERMVTALQERVEEVVDLLHHNDLGLEGVFLAEYAGATGTMMVATPAGDAARKALTFRYWLEE